VFNNGKYSPRAVLTDAAAAFVTALEEMKASGLWPQVRHLLCRWHVYAAIKRHCSDQFRCYPKEQRTAELNRFILAFRGVVCAPNEIQMQALWTSLEQGSGGGLFPQQAVEWVKKNYYTSSKAKKIMECFILNAGNLHQTTTSRNEGMHHAFRSKASVIGKPAEAYKLRRLHKRDWIQTLRSNAARARSRIPLDIQAAPELRELAGKISLFALNEIRKQIRLAKANLDGASLVETCQCHAFHQYELPCMHLVPMDGSAIPLEKISQYWWLDNWTQGM